MKLTISLNCTYLAKKASFKTDPPINSSKYEPKEKKERNRKRDGIMKASETQAKCGLSPQVCWRLALKIGGRHHLHRDKVGPGAFEKSLPALKY